MYCDLPLKILAKSRFCRCCYPLRFERHWKQKENRSSSLKTEMSTWEEILQSERGITLNKILVRFEFLTIASVKFKACCLSGLNHSWWRIVRYTGNKKMTPAMDFIPLQLTGSISNSHDRFTNLTISHCSCNNFGSLQADSEVVFLCVLCIFSWFYSVIVANQCCVTSLIRL